MNIFLFYTLHVTCKFVPLQRSRLAYSYALGGDHPILASLFCRLGDLYYQHGYKLQSKVMLTCALELVEKVLGEYHIVTSAYSMKIATILTGQGRYNDALAMYNRAYTVLMEFDDKFLTDARQCLCGITLCQWHMRRFTEAEKNCLLLLEIAKNSDGKLGLESLDYILLMADVLVTAGEHEKACNYYIDAWNLARCEMNKKCGHVMLKIAQKVFGILFSALTLTEQNDISIFKEHFLEANEELGICIFPYHSDELSVLHYIFITLYMSYLHVLDVELILI